VSVQADVVMHTSSKDGARSVMPTSLLPERIVVALDGAVFGERSLPVASDVAGAIGVDLVLLSVVEYPDDWQDRAIDLDGLRRRYDASSVALLLEPDARRALARRQSDDLLCLATRGRSAVIRSVLGSVAFAEVASGCRTPAYSATRPASV